MLKDIKVENIYIVCGHTDMRKSISGLAEIIQQQFDLDLFSDSLFLFCGRRRNRLKALIWEEDGFVLLYKRLEDGRFVVVKQNCNTVSKNQAYLYDHLLTKGARPLLKD